MRALTDDSQARSVAERAAGWAAQPPPRARRAKRNPKETSPSAKRRRPRTRTSAQHHPAKRKGKGTPKPKNEARPREDGEATTKEGGGRTGAAPRRGEGTATKRSGSEATRKIPRAAGRPPTTQKRKGKKNPLYGGGEAFLSKRRHRPCAGA